MSGHESVESDKHDASSGVCSTDTNAVFKCHANSVAVVLIRMQMES